EVRASVSFIHSVRRLREVRDGCRGRANTDSPRTGELHVASGRRWDTCVIALAIWADGSGCGGKDLNLRPLGYEADKTNVLTNSSGSMGKNLSVLSNRANAWTG